MPRALTALLLGLLLGGPAAVSGATAAEPRWTVTYTEPPAPGAPFEAAARAELPEGYYQDADSAFLTFDPVPGQGLKVLERRRDPPALRGGKPSYTGSFTLTLILEGPLPPHPAFTLGWQICRESGVCLLPASREIAAGPGPAAPAPAAPGWAAMLAAAFAGGLLLNLMPCVFPVLALKGLAFARTAGGPGRNRRREALAAAAGTLTALTSLGLAAAGAAALGQRLDWGFTFQVPAFVAALALAFWVFALQLAGVWTWAGSPFALSGEWRGGTAGSFAGGAFLVAAAAPCTAPLLGPALGWAFTQPPALMPPVFAAAGAGLALPGLVLALVPGLGRLLPAPGPWMRRVERTAAVFLAATALYLLWVLVQQRGAGAWAGGAAAGVLTAGALALTRLPRLRRAGAALAFAAALAGVGAAAVEFPRTAPVLPAGWRAYSAEALGAAREAGAVVLVDATAAWCATCQVNEAAVLLRPDVAGLLAAKGVVRLRADDSLPDPAVARWLAEVGRAGLPVYALYRPGLPVVLFPELLTDANFTAVIAALP